MTVHTGYSVLLFSCGVCFQVSVNGQHFLHYRYRLPLSRVDTLAISGDILVKAVGFLNINVSSLGAKTRSAVASDSPWSAQVWGSLTHPTLRDVGRSYMPGIAKRKKCKNMSEMSGMRKRRR